MSSKQVRPREAPAGEGVPPFRCGPAGDVGPLPEGSCVGESSGYFGDEDSGGVSCLMPLVDMINHVAVVDGGSCEWGAAWIPNIHPDLNVWRGPPIE